VGLLEAGVAQGFEQLQAVLLLWLGERGNGDEPAAQPEHSEGFGVQRGLVRDVHGHVHGQCRVHCSVGKAGGRCVPDLEAGAV